jgi:hypothetical protein
MERKSDVFTVCKPCALNMIHVFDHLLKITEQMGIETEWDGPEKVCEADGCLDRWEDLMLRSAK